MPSVARLFGKHIPIPIPKEFFDETGLLAHLGLGTKELKKIWWYRRRMYEQFSIAKGPKVRLISAPNRRLKILQSKLAPLLDRIYRVRNPVHGFVAARSVKTNAQAHGDRRFVVNLDLQDFFPTITENRIRGLLRALDVDDRVAEIIARLCCLDDHLPQGAPTSPVLSNMICYRLDTDLLRIAKGTRAIYTRYADDISFSSYQPPAPLFDGALPTVGRFSPELLAPDLRAAFQGNGFTVNPSKAHYADRNSRRIITGVKINAGLNVDRRFVRHIRAVFHSIEKFGLTDAQAKYADKGGKGILAAHLRGKISYVAHLKGASDPVVRSLALRYNRCFAGSPIKVSPTRADIIDRAVWVVEHHLDDPDNYGQGSAFFLHGVGLVTAAHCVTGLKEVVVHHPSRPSNKFKATVAHYSMHRDLAVLSHEIPETDFYWLATSTTLASTGTPVTALGYPDFSPADKMNFRAGMVSSTTTKSLIKLFEVNFKLTQGMSGGPVIDSKDEVVGIVHKGGPLEGRDFAIVIGELEKWMSAGFPSD